MVALLHPNPLERTSAPSAVRRTARHLHVVPASPTRTADPFSIAGVAAVMAMVLLVVLVRGVQGAPPAQDWATLSERSIAAQTTTPQTVTPESVTPHTVTVVEGDTWASIGARVAPGVDPVEFARAVASANGGYQLQVGQVLNVGEVLQVGGVPQLSSAG